MKIAIISGSHRDPSQSEKVARHIETALQQKHGVDTWLYVLARNPLPLWDQSLWEDDPEWNERLSPIRKQPAIRRRVEEWLP